MSLPEFQTLKLAIEDGIGILTLSRPDKMNTFNNIMRAELIAAFDHTDANDDIKAVIVTGEGRAFCAGADLGTSGGDTFNYDKNAATDDIIVDGIRRDGGGRVVLRIYESVKPVIAAVNGAAVGVGATMQLPMDARLAVKGAKYGFVFSRRGITPEACSSWFLPRLVGPANALEWFYSGRVFLAEEAHEKGLVQSLHEPDELLPAAKALAHQMTDHSAPVSVAVARQMVYRMMGAEHPMMAHRVDSRSIQWRGGSDDAKEGIAAFFEKRDPNYPNKVSEDLFELPFPKAPEFE